MVKNRKRVHEMKYHYTYRITNTLEKKYYYGVHSCDCLPKEDIGVKYFSSSKNKIFKEDIKKNPQNYKYNVVKIFETRKEAVSHEIFLHNKFEVGKNTKFYNGSKQTSTGFDTSGIKFSDEVNKSKGRNGGDKKYFKNDAVMVKKDNKYFSISKEEFDKGDYNGVTKNKVLTKEKGYVDSDEFKNSNLTSIHAATVTIIENGQTRRITKEEFDKGDYNGVNKNMGIYRDINFNIIRENKNHIKVLTGVLGGFSSKYNYIITDNKGNIYEIVGIYKFAQYYNLPCNKLIKNANRGIIEYAHNTKTKNLNDING